MNRSPSASHPTPCADDGDASFSSTFRAVRQLGVGVAVLIWFLQALLLPDYRAITYPGLAVSFIAEFGLALWLLVKGVKASTVVLLEPRPD